MATCANIFVRAQRAKRFTKFVCAIRGEIQEIVMNYSLNFHVVFIYSDSMHVLFHSVSTYQAIYRRDKSHMARKKMYIDLHHLI